MIFKKRFVIFFFQWLYVAMALAASPAGFTIVDQAVYRFKYNPSESRSLNNYFIKEIAKYNYLELYKTNYNLNYELIVKLNELPNGDFEIIANISLKEMGGDIYYEGFDVSSALLPSDYSFELSFFDKDLRLFKVLKFNDLPIQKNDDRPIYTLDIPLPKSTVLKISGIAFGYQEADKIRFTGRIVQINQFRGFLDLSAVMVARADFINPDESAGILSNYLKIIDLERFSKIVAMLNFNSDLAIPLNDSLKFTRNLFANRVNHLRLLTIFEQNVDTLFVNIGESEINRAANEIVNLQLGYVESLKRSNYLYEPVYEQMQRMFPNADSWFLLLNEMTTFFSKRPNIIFPANFEKVFGWILYKKCFEKADSLIDFQSYNEAVLMLQSAGIICNIQPGHDCDLEVFRGLSKAKYGIYESYIKIADQALNKKSLDLARNYLTLADDFQYTNRSIIILNEPVTQRFKVLADEYCQRGRQAYKDGFAIEALNNLTAARSIYQKLDLTRLSASLNGDLEAAFNMKFLEFLQKAQKSLESNNLDKANEDLLQIQLLADTYPEIDFDRVKFENVKIAISQHRFDALYDSMKTALRFQNFDEALVLMKSLKESNPELFKTSWDEISGYIRLYVKPAILAKIQLAHDMLLLNKIDEIDKLVAEILSLKNSFPVFYDNDVEKAFSDLMILFETGECGSVKSSVTRLTDEANQLITARNFLLAGQKVNQALNQVQAVKDCKVNLELITSLQVTYGDIFAYYQLLNQADEKFGKNDFAATIEFHLRAENFFYQNNIYRFDETYQSLDDLLTSKSSQGLNSTAIGYYSRKQDYQKMIHLFHVYLQNGFDIGKYELYQQEAGKFLAERDKSRFPQSDPVFMLEKLTLGKQDFAPFKSAYLKAWKVLKK